MASVGDESWSDDSGKGDRTETRHGFLEIREIDVSCEVTFPWAMEYI
jgi:hypothetical protein